MEKNGSSGKFDEKFQLENSTSRKRRDVHKDMVKITDYPKTYEHSNKSNERHNFILKNIMVNHYSTIALNKSHIRSKSNTGIELSSSQPLKQTEHSSKFNKHFDLKNKDSTKKHVRRSGFIYHPEVVTKYVYNRKDQLNYEVQPNHQKTQDFLRLLDQPNAMNELQDLDKKNSIDHINTNDLNTRYKPEYSDTEKVNSKLEYLGTRKHVNKGDHEKLNYIPKAEPITKSDSMIFNTEEFANHELIDILDYKNTKQILDTNLDYFNKNENMDAFEKSNPMPKLKLAYFPKQILKFKNVGKRDDDTKMKSVITESANVDLIHKDDEKYDIEHDYLFKQELRKTAETLNIPWQENRPEISNELEHTVEQKYTLNQKNEHEETNDYSINVFDMENKLANADNLFRNKANNDTMTTLRTTRGLRLQEQFGNTRIDNTHTSYNLTTIFFERTTPTLLNLTGT